MKEIANRDWSLAVLFPLLQWEVSLQSYVMTITSGRMARQKKYASIYAHLRDEIFVRFNK